MNPLFSKAFKSGLLAMILAMVVVGVAAAIDPAAITDSLSLIDMSDLFTIGTPVSYGLLCGCEPGVELADVQNRSTSQNFGEIQKIIIQRTYNGTAFNEFVVATADPALKASWAGLLTANDDTKAVTTPFIHGLTNETGDPIEFGGNGETVGGVPQIVGKSHTSFSGNFHGAWQTTMAALESYACDTISVFFVNECNQIAGLSDDPTNPTTFRGFPLAKDTWYVSDKKLGGKTAPDMNEVGGKFYPNWSKNFTVITPTDFTPIDDADFNPVV